MSEIEDVSKQFDRILALDGVSAQIEENCIFGLVGTNGAGKSTLLRIISGVLHPDHGQVRIDGYPVWENPRAKGRLCFLADTAYFFANATPRSMGEYYRVLYPGFDSGRYEELLERFELDPKRKLSTFSKGMKKQVSVLLGLCTNTEYLLCDEPFDGLDPVMRQTVKSLFANDIEERNLTPVIASHNLRELEDICDHVGLLHKGGMLLSKDLDDMKLNIHKIQCVLPAGVGSSDLQGIDIIKTEQRGSLLTLTVRGKREEIQTILQAYHPVFFEMIPLSLEEIFISETEVAGYDIKRLVF